MLEIVTRRMVSVKQLFAGVTLLAITVWIYLLLTARPCTVLQVRPSFLTPTSKRVIEFKAESNISKVNVFEKIVSKFLNSTNSSNICAGCDEAVLEPFLEDLLRGIKDKLASVKKIVSVLSQPVVNPHNHTYLYNPRLTCSKRVVHLLIVVPSATGNFIKRAKVRNSSRSEYVRVDSHNARMLFFIGGAKSKIEQVKIDAEAKLYGDIVQENYADVYKNIRTKAVSMLKWASQFCENAKFVIRTDDDVAINVTKLVSILETTKSQIDNFILGRVKVRNKPLRNPKNKYYLSTEEFPDEIFPPFALGGLLGFPMSSVKLLYQAALRIKPIWLDDVYVTGICAPQVAVTLVNNREFDFKHWSW
ncbi:beta-1,3-galactosyltransferase 5-like [Physella acuta]|uniref:beta-1,3-galactosyltransferase 5-like n=1 Tax=Physella acuta TaxID=109671 RepID=UPI0027DD9C17|nr:beta-1,3-galactosyltransferase 5-like [Physella acuta]